MTLTAAKVGGWAFADLLLHDEVSHLQSELIKAIDGTGGGIYTLHDDDLTLATDAAKKLILALDSEINAGKTLTLAGTIALLSSGRINLPNGAGINVFEGAAVNIDGTGAGGAINIANGGTLNDSGAIEVLGSTGRVNFRSGAGLNLFTGAGMNLATGSILTAAAGALLDIFCGITLESGALLDVLSGGSVDINHGASLAVHQANGIFISDTGANNVGAWFSRMCPVALVTSKWLLVSTGTPTHFFEQVDISTQAPIIFPVPLLPGDQCTSITVKINVAAQSGFSLNKPIVTLFRVDSSGNRTNVAVRTDPSASQLAYETTHDIVLDASHVDSGAMPQTVSTQPLFVEIKGQSGADAQTNALQVLSIRGDSIQRSYRVPIEVG